MKLKVLVALQDEEGSVVQMKTINFEFDQQNDDHKRAYDHYKETGDLYALYNLFPENFFGKNDFSIISVQEEF